MEERELGEANDEEDDGGGDGIMMEWAVVAAVVVIMVKSDEFKSGFESIEGLGFFSFFFFIKKR